MYSTSSRAVHFCSPHAMTSSVINHITDGCKNEIYLLTIVFLFKPVISVIQMCSKLNKFLLQYLVVENAFQPKPRGSPNQTYQEPDLHTTHWCFALKQISGMLSLCTCRTRWNLTNRLLDIPTKDHGHSCYEKDIVLNTILQSH